MTDISTKAIIERCDHIDHCSLNTHHQDAMRMRALVDDRDRLRRECDALAAQLTETRQWVFTYSVESAARPVALGNAFTFVDLCQDEPLFTVHGNGKITCHPTLTPEYTAEKAWKFFLSAMGTHNQAVDKAEQLQVERDTLAKQAEDTARICAKQADKITVLSQSRYDLAYAIAGGEDAPGLLDSVPDAELVEMIAKERANSRDFQEAAVRTARNTALVEAAEKIAGQNHVDSELRRGRLQAPGVLTRAFEAILSLRSGPVDDCPECSGSGMRDSGGVQPWGDHIEVPCDCGNAPHPDDAAVDRFAAAMKAKLAAKRADGRGGWDDKDQCSQQFLSDLLRGHVDKGDTVDVANFAMMLHQRGEMIAPVPAAFGFFEDKYPQAVMPSEARSEVLEPLTVEQLVKILNKLSEELHAAEPAPCSGDMSSQGMPITFTYTNWRGETAQRTVVPKRIWFGSTDWHPEPGWLMTAHDLEKAADRDFALADCAFAAPLQSAQEGVSPITSLITDVVARAEKAMLKHPQPNYIISKFAEESGEVTKALIHAAENRESWDNVSDEIVDTLAMLHRLFVEGDQVHGLRPLNDLAQEAQGDD